MVLAGRQRSGAEKPPAAIYVMTAHHHTCLSTIHHVSAIHCLQPATARATEPPSTTINHGDKSAAQLAQPLKPPRSRPSLNSPILRRHSARTTPPPSRRHHRITL
mmetsp:Transcript_19088/g.34507  ORF Transcript_19088/g.34507 Transcript_19088/m.34507 type:complete len:105 (-) Transcript_19088:245-559(-)